MHGGQIRRRCRKVIVGIVVDHLAAIWHIIAQGILESNLCFAGIGFTVGGGICRSPFRIGAQVGCGPQHSVIIQADPGICGAVVLLCQFLCEISEAAPLHGSTDGEKDVRMYDLIQMVNQRQHILLVHITGGVHLAPFSHIDALHDIDTVGIPVYDFRCLRHVLQNQLQGFRFMGGVVPIVQETDDHLLS